jgi:hypothetical protein
MATHKREAFKYQNAKAVWLRSHLQEGRLPQVVVLESVPVHRSSAAERRWFRRLSSRFQLLNQSTPGAGNPGVGRVIWTNELLDLLGEVPDSEIAGLIGCERKTVSYKRECLGITASFDRKNNKSPPANAGWNAIRLPPEIIDLLGTVSDQCLADRAGVSKKRIMRERHDRQLPSYADLTGNDGRIRSGEPHRRWK